MNYASRLKNLTARSIFDCKSESSISISPIRPKEVYHLFRKTQLTVRQLGYEKPYIRNLQVYVRKAANSPSKLIRNQEDLRSLSSHDPSD